MDASHTIQSVKEGHVTFIRTNERIWHKIKKNMIHHEMKKAEKPDIFWILMNSYLLLSIHTGNNIISFKTYVTYRNIIGKE